jgi:MFS family permease
VKKRPALLQIFGHREPRLLITGQTVSGFGDGIANVAFVLLVLDTTHSVSKLAVFAAARMIPTVGFLLVGGAIVDRFSRRVLLLISDLSRALLTAAVVALLLAHSLHFWELLVFAFLFGTFDAVFMPAISALTPEIVPEELLPAMNAVRPLTNNFVGQMLGPAAGGLLAAWSTTTAIGVDCATFLVSAGALVMMHATPRPARGVGTSMLDEIRQGLRYVRKTPWLWTTLAAVAPGNALVYTPMAVLLAFYMEHHLHAGKPMVGYLFATMGLTGALGALYAGSMKSPRRRVRVTWAVWTVSSLAALFMGLATHTWIVFIFPALASPCIYLGNVIWESMIQSDVPRELLGRVTSVDWFVSLGLSPVGLIVAGYLATRWGVRTYFVVMGLVCTVPGIFILLSRKINEVDGHRLRVERPPELSGIDDASPVTAPTTEP